MTEVPALSATPTGGRWRVAVKLAGDLGARALSLLLLAGAARLLEPAQFGAYAFALAVGLIGGQLADGGLQFTLLRRLSAEPDADRARSSLAGALRARMVAAVAAGSVAALVAALLGPDLPGAAALAVVAAAQVAVAQGELWLQVSRAAGRLELEAVATVGARLLLVSVGLALLLAGLGLGGLAIAHVVGAGAAVLLARRAARQILPRSIAPAQRDAWQMFRESLPLAAAGIASLLMFRVDALLLGWLRGPLDVGLYTAAYRPFEVMLLPQVALMAWGFPLLVRAAASRSALGPALTRLAVVLLAAAVGAALAAWLVAPPLLTAVFGAPYAAAGPLFQLLVLALPQIYLNALLTQLLIALDRPWWVAACFVVGLTVNVVGNLALIPSLGPTGAALATITAETAVLVAAAAGAAGRWRALPSR